MPLTLAFDVYGTLIDTHGVVSELRNLSQMGDNAEHFSRLWREKQLEYSFRRGLMQKYEPFPVCTRDALDYSCAYFKAELTDQERNNLLKCYSKLPAFEDVSDGLASLKADKHRLFAFSNGASEAVNGLLVSAGIRDYFEAIVSVEDLQTFKPNPAVYRHFLNETGARADQAWLISSNPFDVIVAISMGMSAAWVKRSKDAIFDPWGIEPTQVVANLNELSQVMPDG